MNRRAPLAIALWALGIGLVLAALGAWEVAGAGWQVELRHPWALLVLPATLANPQRSMLAANGNSHGGSTSTGDGASGGGDNYHITVHAFDATGVERMMRGPAGDSIVKGLVAKRRNLQGAGVS